MKKINIFLSLLLVSIFSVFAQDKVEKEQLEVYYKFHKLILLESVNSLKQDKKVQEDPFIQGILNRDVSKVEKLVDEVNLDTKDGEHSKVIHESHIKFCKLDKDFLKAIEFDLSEVPIAIWAMSPLLISIINYCSASNKIEKDASFKIIEILLKNKGNPNEKLGRAYFDKEGRDYISYYLLSLELLEYNCPIEIFELLLKHNLKADYKIDGFATNNGSLRELSGKFLRDDILSLIK